MLRKILPHPFMSLILVMATLNVVMAFAQAMKPLNHVQKIVTLQVSVMMV